LITTISGKIYRFLGTIEILEETLKISWFLSKLVL
jgi:hypothetical protein